MESCRDSRRTLGEETQRGYQELASFDSYTDMGLLVVYGER